MNASKSRFLLAGLVVILLVSQFLGGRGDTAGPKRTSLPEPAHYSSGGGGSGTSTKIPISILDRPELRSASADLSIQQNEEPLSSEEIEERIQKSIPLLREREAAAEAERAKEAQVALQTPRDNPYESLDMNALEEQQRRARLNPDFNNPYERLAAESQE